MKIPISTSSSHVSDPCRWSIKEKGDMDPDLANGCSTYTSTSVSTVLPAHFSWRSHEVAAGVVLSTLCSHVVCHHLSARDS